MLNAEMVSPLFQQLAPSTQKSEALYFPSPLEALMSQGAMMTTASLETRLLDLRNGYIRSLPERIAAIAESLRRRLDGGSDTAETLDRQFHNLAGTAGTYGLLAVAASAREGFDECSSLEGDAISSHARYLWSIVEELGYAAADPSAFDVTTDAVFQTMNPHPASLVGQNGGRA
jgi:hypothetical protein